MAAIDTSIDTTGREDLEKTYFRPVSGDDWQLDLVRYRPGRDGDALGRPLLMVPGYAMNAFILGFHPTGDSMVEYLVRRGFEVWTANLRGQGSSRPLESGAEEGYGFRELALVDLDRAIDVVLEETETGADRVQAIGCSIGVSIVYAYLAHLSQSHRVESVVAVGGPLRWEKTHPLMRAVFANPAVAGMLPTAGVPQMARLAIPVVRNIPALAGLYMNARQIDLSRASELVKTIDNPDAHLNRQIARWLENKDLVVDGRNVTLAMRRVETPVLCVLANRDGIVPPESVLSIADAIGTDQVDLLRVGSPERWYAHADLFVAERAAEDVFEPLADWLE